MSVTTGRTPSIDCFKRKVGSGSNSHDFDADFITIFLTSSIEAGDRKIRASPLNLTSALRKPPLSLQNRVEELRSFRIASILLMKNVLNLFERSRLFLCIGRTTSFVLPIRLFVSLCNCFWSFPSSEILLEKYSISLLNYISDVVSHMLWYELKWVLIQILFAARTCITYFSGRSNASPTMNNRYMRKTSMEFDHYIAKLVNVSIYVKKKVPYWKKYSNC